MYYDYDPELPRGFQDADFEMRDLEEAARQSVTAKKKGVCLHGWLQGPPGKPKVTCNDCGKTFDSFEDAYDEGRSLRESF